MEKTIQKLNLEEVTINGFKSIDSLNVKINKGLNILIGKNGSGKSNFLESLNDVLSNSGYRRAGFKSAVLYFVAADGVKIKMEMDKLSKSPELSLLNDNDPIEDFDRRLKTAIKIFIEEEKIFDNIRKVTPKNKRASTNSLPLVFRKFLYHRLTPKYLSYHIPETLECIDTAGTFYASFDSDGDVTWSDIETLRLVQRVYSELESKTEYEQENVAALTRESILETMTIPANVRENLRMYSPILDIRFNENINIYREDKGVTIENVKLEFLVNKTWLPWSQLSDGTKRIFYLISEITTHETSLILLEEPELGVHPHQFGQIMEFILEASKDRQIIISTHSPIALNHLQADQLDHILIAKYDLKKGTQIKHLVPAQKKKGKIYMDRIGQLSDFWMLSDLEQ